MPWQPYEPLSVPCKDEFYCVNEGWVSLCPARPGSASGATAPAT